MAKPNDYKNLGFENIDFAVVYHYLTKEQLNHFFQFGLEAVNCTNFN